MSDALAPEEVIGAEGEIRLVAPNAGSDICWECGHQLDDRHAEWCLNYPTPEIAARRKAMEAKLDAVAIDPSHITSIEQRVRSRTLAARYVDIEARAEMAKAFLLVMISAPGDKQDKVRAAVEYADLLLEELEVRS